MSPTLSVIMPNYNHARFIPDALQAILAQSYRPVEVLILDDCSTDDSLRVLDRFATQESGLLRVLRNDRNLGVVESCRRLLAQATGDYVYAAAADDRLLPTFFERSMTLLARHPESGLSSTLSRIIDEGGRSVGVVQAPIIRRVDSFLPPADVLCELRRCRSWFMGNTTVFRRAALVDAGGWIPDLGPYCDGFICLVVALRHGACFIPEALAAWRRMEGTYSRRQAQNLDATLRMYETAERLMRSTYRDVFPDDYVDEWKREVRYQVTTSLVSSSTDPSLSGIERLIPHPTATDRVAFSILRTWPGLRGRFAQPYFFVRFMRSHIWRTLRRKVTYLLEPRFHGTVD